VDGRLLRLESVPRPSTIDISCSRRTNKAAPDVAVHHTRLPTADRVMVDGILCTSATRTIVDLAATLDPERLETVFERAPAAPDVGACSRGSRRRSLPAGKAGSGSVKELLRVLEPRPRESRFEVRVARLLRKHGIRASANRFVVGRYRLDVAWPERLLGLECDGFEHHGHRLVWKRDRRRIAALEAAGSRLIHLTWDDVTHHPHETVMRLQVALQRAVA
jgi:very-short-patch-repair endonuclease